MIYTYVLNQQGQIFKKSCKTVENAHRLQAYETVTPESGNRHPPTSETFHPRGENFRAF